MSKSIKSILKAKPAMKEVVSFDDKGNLVTTMKKVDDLYLVTFSNGNSVALREDQFVLYDIDLNDAEKVDPSLKKVKKSGKESKQEEGTSVETAQ